MTNTLAKRQNGNGNGDTTTFGNVVDNIFQSSLRRFFDDNFWEPGTSVITGSVPVNIRETEQQYELDVIAPGCHKENFKISVHDNLLTVSFEQKEENEEKQKRHWHRNEYVQRSFSRSFTVDDTVDVNNIGAVYSDGILRIILGKNEKAKKISRKIEIK